jgi:hypothetical protein
MINDKGEELSLERQDQALIIALMCGQDVATEDEMNKVVQWGRETHTRMELLELAVNGRLLFMFEDGELMFKANQDPQKREIILSARDLDCEDCDE